MSKRYEAEWIDVLTNTDYPLENSALSDNLILDITINHDKRVHISKIESDSVTILFTLSELDDTSVGTIELGTGNTGFFPIKDSESEIIGYIRIGKGISKYNAVQTDTFNSNQNRIIFGTQYVSTLHETINTLKDSIIYKEGFNLDIELRDDPILEDATILVLRPELGGGRGKFCGQRLFRDAVYNINSVVPNQNREEESVGNLEWTHRHFFDIQSDKDNHKVLFSLTIPEERLTCFREGSLLLKGPKGFTGPQGVCGVPGTDAPEVDFSCTTCDVSDVCCECDVVEDFCGQAEIG